jgi:predicted glycogen debranching enzyme
MAYISFKKEELINLEFALGRELIRTNRAGSYSSSTIIGCNTRKYHGLLICPLPELDGERHVLLSNFDETIIQHGASFNLGIHKYPQIFEPRGHKYLRNFSADPIPTLIYRVGGVVLKKEQILVNEEARIIIRYTLEDAHSATTLRFKPFLAYRSVHNTTRENLYANTKYQQIENGIKVKLYDSYPDLFMQFSKKADYVHVPHWYYNLEYIEDQKAGQDYQEDLFVPGYFEIPIKKGEQIIFSASINESTPKLLLNHFNKELKSRIPRDSFLNCLKNSAQQFIVKNGKTTKIVAGFPWFGTWGRDTFISLPGLTLSMNDTETFNKVMKTMGASLKNGLFPNIEDNKGAAYNTADASLWYFWSVQKYLETTGDYETVKKDYLPKMLEIFKAYLKGTKHNIRMETNGLIYTGEEGHALTWMDVVINKNPVTPRHGFAVEINALWFNAVSFLKNLAEKFELNEWLESYSNLNEQIQQSFIDMFWDNQKGYLADYTTYDFKDWKVRPNMLFAASLPYKVCNEDICKSILDKVQSYLLTTRGIRTLSPNDPDYKGTYEGNQIERDLAYHQGTAWPWLLGAFIEAYLNIYGKSGVHFTEKLISNFEAEMSNHGIGSISEIYSGDPPHTAIGAISQAWSVAELLRAIQLIENTKNMKA